MRIPADAVELQLGESTPLTAHGLETTWCMFAPGESGMYEFYTSGRQSGDARAQRSGDAGGRQSGDAGAQQSGDASGRQSGDAGAQRSGDASGWQSDDAGGGQSGDAGAQRSGDVGGGQSGDAGGGQSGEGEPPSFADTWGMLEVAEGDMLVLVEKSYDDVICNGDFSIKQTLTAGKTYYLSCNALSDEDGDEGVAYAVSVRPYEFDEHDLASYGWSMETSRIPSKDATSLEAVLDVLQPYAVSPMGGGGKIPFDELSAAACYREVRDEKDGGRRAVEASFDSPLEPGQYAILLTGKGSNHGQSYRRFAVFDESEIADYERTYENWIPVEKATSEAALVKAMDIKFFDFYAVPIKFTYGTNYSVEWYKGHCKDPKDATILASFPNEPGFYSAKLVGNDSEQIGYLDFELYEPNSFSENEPYFENEVVYADGDRVSVAKLGGLAYERYDGAPDEDAEVKLEAGVDFDVEWVVCDEYGDAGAVLPSAPKDAGEYFARVTAKGETSLGTYDVPFRIADPHDIGNYDFRGVDEVKCVGKPITFDQLGLKAYRLDVDSEADVKFKVGRWCKGWIAEDYDIGGEVDEADVGGGNRSI